MVFDCSQAGLDTMLKKMRPHVWRSAGLAIRSDKWSYASSAGEQRPPPASTSHPMLSEMEHHGPETCLNASGRCVQVGPARAQAWEELKKKCWAAFHMR